jgi:transposase-like protein
LTVDNAFQSPNSLVPADACPDFLVNEEVSADSFVTEEVCANFLVNEEACADYLFSLKWPNGYSCPSCSFRHAYRISTRRLPLYECSRCGHQASLIAGTVMEGTRTSLSKWFKAINLISDPQSGISASSLSRTIAVTYKTAWTILHKIRLAMAKSEAANPLSGNIILNDSCYGRPYNPSVNLHPQETPVLIGASMIDGEPSRIVIRAVSPKHLLGNQITRHGTAAFIQQHVSPNAIVSDTQVRKYSPRKLKLALPLFHHAYQWINATFHGLGVKHLQTYFAEFCCRTNIHLTNTPIFQEISRICTSFGSVPYSRIIRRTPYT